MQMISINYIPRIIKLNVEVQKVAALLPCNELAVCCKVLFDQEDTAVLTIGALSIAEESCCRIYPGSGKADED